MIKKEPVYDITDAESLNKFLLGSLSELKRNELQLDKADAISKLADKVVKLNLTRLLYKKAVNSEVPIDFFESTMLISKTK
jgi:hypothetical protein